ncbi:MAG: septum formation protein Maf [Anaerolineales bacterium]|nr:septum formation protein Maf [Anaerolineales bacterium]
MSELIDLVLASASPRRRELLSLLTLPFRVEQADIDESQRPDEPPFELVQRLSKEKAGVVAQRPQNRTSVILAADTIVLLVGRVLGKPDDEAHAREMLTQLRGQKHRVMTSITVIDNRTGKAMTEVCESKVTLRWMSDEEIDGYVQSGDPMDKAAAYAVQNEEFSPAEQLIGCPANVMGLPMCHVVMLFRRLGIDLPASLPLDCRVQFGGYYCALAELAMPGLTEQGMLP